MAAASAAAKGWSITLAGAAFGVAVIRDKAYLIVLDIVALVVFGIVDGLYLYNEKRFRALYAAIACWPSLGMTTMGWPFVSEVDDGRASRISGLLLFVCTVSVAR